jgi:hypothetical protein
LRAGGVLSQELLKSFGLTPKCHFMINYDDYLLLFNFSIQQIKFCGALFLIVLCCHNIIERLRDISRSVHTMDKKNSNEKNGDTKKPIELWWNLVSIIVGLLLLLQMGEYILSVIQTTK